MLLILLACTPKEPPATDDTAPAPDDSDPIVDTHDSEPPPPDDTATIPNSPPSAPEIAITPPAPQPGEDFSVVIVVPSVDPDKDAVTYRYAWTRDGAAAADVDDTISGADTALLEVWEVTVTPTDETDDGPAATARVTIGNSAPTPPVISITPELPIEGDDLELHFDVEAVDPDGDPITTTILWYDNGSHVGTFDDSMTVSGAYVDNDEEWTAIVSVTDGLHDAVTVEASVYAAWTCDNLPPGATDYQNFTDAVAYHGIDFDPADGMLIGWDGRSGFFKSEYGGSSSLWVPYTSTVQQIDTLPDGDFVFGDSSGRLVRLSASGATSTISGSVGSAYGVVTGPDGNVWVANGSAVLRVDPDSGEVTTIVSDSSIYTHSLQFNLDSTQLYIGTIGSGVVYAQELDSNLDPVGSPTSYATGVGGGYHDGLEVDECGNLYVADYTTRGFYRVATDGTVTTVLPTVSAEYGHGAKWGNGIGGWRADAIYQPQPYNGNTVREVVIGFESADTVRTFNGVPVTY